MSEISSYNQAHRTMTRALAHYDELAADGQANSEAEQGFENWVRIDEREWRNLGVFLHMVDRVATRTNNHLLMGGCSDGLAAQTIAEEGYLPTGYDFSQEMVTASRRRLARADLHGAFYQADATDLDLELFPPNYAGATFIHVANCIPIAGKDDDLLRKALIDLSSRAPDGPLYVPTTYYPDAIHNRELSLNGNVIGIVPYYYRPVETFREILGSTGRELVHAEHFDARLAPEGDPAYGYDYLNDYLVFGPENNK